MNGNGRTPRDASSRPARSIDADARAAARPLIGVTMGDPRGIGAEVIVKALADPELRRSARFLIYGIDSVLRRAAEAAGIAPYWFHGAPDAVGHVDTGVFVLDHAEFNAFDTLETGPSRAGGEASLKFLEGAIAAAREGRIAALVTGPIHKASWQAARSRFPGHTELLADACNTRRVNMMFVADSLRVALASGHLGLFELRHKFTIGLVFQPVDLLAQALIEWFGIENPRIAVAALNPHAGEDGQFGDEERRIIEPALTLAQQQGIEVEGPFPADSLFVPERLARFDGVVAMYHDQGLIPVKMTAFHSAVHLTLGLPIIRTSVDHGTAFDIAGRSRANPGSMSAAIALAIRLARQSQAPEWAAPPDVIPQM